MPAPDDPARRVNEFFGIPDREVADFDWPQIEQAVGTELPADYKLLSDYYPPGWFRRFARISRPERLPDGAQRLLSEFEVGQMETLRAWRAAGHGEFPYPLYPEPGGLLTWGVLRGGYAFWLTTSAEPDEWPVVLASAECDHWERFEGNMSDFLAEVAAARYDATGFSEGPFRVTMDSSGNWTKTGPPVILADRPLFEPDPPAPSQSPVPSRSPAPPRSPAAITPPADFWPKYARRAGSRPCENEMAALRELIGEPTWHVPDTDWAAAHAQLGFQLPADYREFIDTYGPGTFADIRITGPEAPEEMNLFSLLERKYERVSRVDRRGMAPYYPEPGGAVCWGETLAGWACGWVPISAGPDEWTVAGFAPTKGLRAISLSPGMSFTTTLRVHAKPGRPYVESIPPRDPSDGPVKFIPCKSTGM